MEEKLTVGFIPVAAQFFLQGGVLKKDAPGFRWVEKSIKDMIGIIDKKHTVISDGLITSVKEAELLKKKFIEKKVDVIVATNIIWSEDQLLLKVIKELRDVPVLIWCYSPFIDIKNGLTMDDFVRATGPCGTYQSLPAIIRMGRKIKFLVGTPDEQSVQKELNDFLDANVAVKKLRNSRIALIPSRWDVQTDTIVDESMLTDIVGPEIVHFSVHDIKKFFDKIRDSEVDKHYKELKEKYEIEKVKEEVVKISIKASLAMRDFSRHNEIDAISYNENSPDLHEIIGLNPCIYLEDLYNHVKVIGMEGDLLNVTSLLILRYLTDDGIMFSEILTIDRRDHFLLVGHPGNHDIKRLVDAHSDIRIVPDYEWKDSELNIHGYEGAWMHFVARKGETTVSQLLYHRCELKMIYIRARSLNIKIIDYYPQATLQLPIASDGFLYRAGKIGCGHHLTFAYGDVRGTLKDLAHLLGIKAIDIEKCIE